MEYSNHVTSLSHRNLYAVLVHATLKPTRSVLEAVCATLFTCTGFLFIFFGLGASKYIIMLHS